MFSCVASLAWLFLIIRGRKLVKANRMIILDELTAMISDHCGPYLHIN